MPLKQHETNEVYLAIQAFATNRLSYDRANAILSQFFYTDKEVNDLLSWMYMHQLRNAATLNLLWPIIGCDAFIRVCVGSYLINSEVSRLLNEKLKNESDLFSSEMIAKVQQYYPDCRPAILELRTRQLVQKADLLIQQPAEINRDAFSVRAKVNDYGFPPELNELLDKIDLDLGAKQDGFDEAATLKHIRTFVEELHKQCILTLREKCPRTQFKVGYRNSTDNTPLDKHQGVLDFLERHGVLTDKMKELSKALYGVLSNEGVHAITSRRDYVRLFRNMVIEYAIVLFHELDRRILLEAG